MIATHTTTTQKWQTKNKTKTQSWSLRNEQLLSSFLSYLQRLWYLMYFKNPEGRKTRVCARERRHCCGLQSQWCQMMTSLIFEAHAIIAHVRAVTELPGFMISTTFTGGALLVGANQEHDRILCLLLLLLFSIFGPHRHYHFLYLYNRRKFFEHSRSTPPLVPPTLCSHY